MSVDSLERRRFVVDESTLPRWREQARQILDQDELAEVTDAVLSFTETLLRVDTVDGVAFLCAKFPHCPPSLSVDVLMPLKPGDEDSTVAYRRVAQANAELAEKISGSFSSGLSFINTDGINLDSITPSLYREWNVDPQSTLIAYIVFDRGDQ